MVVGECIKDKNRMVLALCKLSKLKVQKSSVDNSIPESQKLCFFSHQHIETSQKKTPHAHALMTIFRIFLILAGLLEILSFSRGPRLGGKWTQSARSSALREVSQVTTSLRATIDPRQDIADRYSELSGSNITDIGLGLSQLEPFLKIAVPYFQNDATARSSLVAVSALTLLNSGISVAFSYISRDFYNALNARDESLFYEKIELFFGALVLGVPVSVLYRFVREKLALYWREALTAQALQQYYGNRTFYILETLREVDNPDQRISEDIRRFTSTSLDFFITIFTSIIDLLSFSAILFQIFPGLFLAIILYAGIGSVITTKIGRNLVALNYERLQREANFRFALFRTRENAEAIAFYDSEAKLEQENVWKLFQSALATQLSIVQTQRNLEVFTTAYRYIVQILPSLIVAPLYFQHKVELGAISQSYGAFNHILGDFSIIINSFESLSAFAAGLTRLGDFFDRIGGPSAAIGGGWGYLPSSSDETFANMFKTEMRTTRNSKPLISLHTVNFSQETLQLRPPQSESLRQSEFLKQRSQRPVLVQVQDLVVLTPDGTRCVLGSLRNDYHYRNNLSNSGRTIQGEQMALQARNTNDERAPKTTSSPSGTHDLHGPSSPSLLYRGIDLTFHAGDRVLIVGPSGAGKSSLVRVLAGLWSVGTGTIFWSDTLVTSSTLPSRPATTIGNLSADITHLSNNYTAQRSAPNGVFFLPQKPYNLLGDLREQIMYPATTSTSTTSATSSSFSSNQETRTDMLSPNRGDDKVSADSPLAPSIYQRMRLDQIAPSTSSAIVDPHLKLHAGRDDASLTIFRIVLYAP